MISKILRYDLLKYVYYNYFCKNVVKNGNYKIYPERHSVINLSKNSKLILDGNLFLNVKRYKGSKAEAYLCLRGKGILHIKGETRIRFNSTIQVDDGAKLEMGRFTCNANINIQCASDIVIGDDCMFGRNVVVYDSSYHPTGTSKDDLSVSKVPVHIGNHVWLGANVTIMQGTTIADGSVVGTGVCISGNIPNNSFVAPKFDKPSMAGMMWARSMNAIEEAMPYAPKTVVVEEKQQEIVLDNENDEVKTKILNFLAKSFPDIDFEASETLLDDGIIDSLIAVTMVTSVADEFEIEIPFEEITKDNLNSLKNFTALITKILNNN